MRIPGIIFDGDDTLWETMPLYTEAKQKFFGKMTSLGFSQAEVKKEFERIDQNNVLQFGFSKERFPTSMVNTYAFFCSKYRVHPTSNIEQQVRTIGSEVFSRPPLLIDNAARILSQLRSKFYVILLTKGDFEIQRHRIEQVGMSESFDRIFIVEHKSIKELNSVIDECRLDMNSSWAVGNSIRSDINPAIEAGLKAIWIPYYTWDYEEEETLSSNLLFKGKTLHDVVKLTMEQLRVLPI